MNESKLIHSVSLATLSLGAAGWDWVTQHVTIASVIAVGAGVASIFASYETWRAKRAERKRIEGDRE